MQHLRQAASLSCQVTEGGAAEGRCPLQTRNQIGPEAAQELLLFTSTKEETSSTEGQRGVAGGLQAARGPRFLTRQEGSIPASD